MKRLKSFAVITSLFIFAAAGAVEAEMVPIYGPVYVSKTKKEGDDHHRKEAKINFTAPVPGNGVIVVKNGGDTGKKARVGAAEIELNGLDIAKPKDFNKTISVREFNVQLLSDNEMEVEVKSCRECEIEITVMGEKPVPLPVRALVPAAEPLVFPTR